MSDFKGSAVFKLDLRDPTSKGREVEEIGEGGKVIHPAPQLFCTFCTHTHTTVLRLCGNCPGQPG